MKQEPSEKRTIQSSFMDLVHLYFLKIFNQLGEYDLHPGQIAVLKELYKQEGLSQRELADLLNIKPPTVAVSIKRMEKKGFLERKTDEQDKRIMRIYLTPYGKEVNESIKQLLKQNEEDLLQGFEEGEMYLLQRFLKQMIENTKKTLPQKVKDQNCHFNHEAETFGIK